MSDVNTELVSQRFIYAKKRESRERLPASSRGLKNGNIKKYINHLNNNFIILVIKWKINLKI